MTTLQTVLQPAFGFAAQDFIDLSQKRVLIGLSGGINSMAALCYLGVRYPAGWKPSRVWLYYAHLEDHSPDTLDFVKAGIDWALDHFEHVYSRIAYMGSVLDFFEGEKMIPHPIISPCSEHLKFGPMMKFADQNRIDLDLIGFIRNERQRITRQQSRNPKGAEKIYPVSHMTEEDCFEIVDSEIGWHPSIYDIRDEAGKRIFKHNNCLPCKNMVGRLDGCSATGDFQQVQRYYPEYFMKAQALSRRLGKYWGREASMDGHCKLCED